MKYLFILILLLLGLMAFCQEDTTLYQKYPTAYGPQYKDIWATRVMRLPDTTNNRPQQGVPGALARNTAGTAIFLWNGSTWVPVTGGGGGISPLFPTVGTGTATGDVTGNLSGHSLTADGASSIFMTATDGTTNGVIGVTNEAAGIAIQDATRELHFDMSASDNTVDMTASDQVASRLHHVTVTPESVVISKGGAGSTTTNLKIPYLDSGNANANNVMWMDAQHLVHRGHITAGSGGGGGIQSLDGIYPVKINNDSIVAVDTGRAVSALVTGGSLKKVADSLSVTLPRISSLQPAIATNTIDNLNFKQRWYWSTLVNDTALVINTTGNQTGSTKQIGLAVLNSGTGAAADTSFSLLTSNSKTGGSVWAAGFRGTNGVIIDGASNGALVRPNMVIAPAGEFANNQSGAIGFQTTNTGSNNQALLSTTAATVNTVSLQPYYKMQWAQSTFYMGYGGNSIVFDVTSLGSPSYAGGKFIFKSKAYSSLLIDSNFVGIGTITPVYPLDVNGDVRIGSMSTGSAGDSTLVVKGGVIKKVASLVGSATLDFPSTASSAVSDLTISVPGAVAGDVVALGIPANVMTAKGAFVGWVSAADVVTIRFSPVNSTEDPPSAVFKVRVVR